LRFFIRGTGYWLEYLGLHKKPKAEVHPGHRLTGPKEKEEAYFLASQHCWMNKVQVVWRNHIWKHTPERKKLFYGSYECVCNKWFSRVRLNYKSWCKLQRIGAACFKDTHKRRNISHGDTDIVLRLYVTCWGHRNKDDCERRRRKETEWIGGLLNYLS
jgi:hypothetical protein